MQSFLQHIVFHGGATWAVFRNDIPENLTENVNSSAKIGGKACTLVCGYISTLFYWATFFFMKLMAIVVDGNNLDFEQCRVRRIMLAIKLTKKML